jgi:hypothetical protein
MSIIIPDPDHLDLVLTPLLRAGDDHSRLTFVGREILKELYGQWRYREGGITEDDMKVVRAYVFNEVTEDVTPLRVLAAAHWLGYQLSNTRDDVVASIELEKILGAAIRGAIAGEDGGEWQRSKGSVRKAISELAGARTVTQRREQFDF